MMHRSPSDSWLIIDEDYIVLKAAECMRPHVHFCVGRCIWDVFPGSEEVFKPTYDRGFKHGCHVEAVEYGGVVVRVDCVRIAAGKLMVTVQSVPLARPEDQATAIFHCRICDETFEDVLPPLVDMHWPSCCDIPSFLVEQT